jgi:hypothetical protein
VPALLKIFVNLNKKPQIRFSSRRLGIYAKLDHTYRQIIINPFKDHALC